jgi:hypothetical protein
MVWRVLQLRGIGRLLLIALVAVGTPASGKNLDAKGEINLALRAYASTRIQTQDTDRVIFKQGPEETAGQFYRSLTFPISKAGQVRQARYFIQLEYMHDIQRLYEEKFGPLALLHALPFDFRSLRYQLIYRGEGDGVYDFGPKGFRTRDQYHLRGFPTLPNENVPAFSGNSVQFVDPATGRSRLDGFRETLRDKLSNRNRLFQAFVDFQVEDMFIRFGRQILVWGETDAFRLMDNINPVDNGFGGFLIPLDERRVPLDMLRANYYMGDFGKVGLSGLGLYEAYFEAFWAVDNAVGWFPGINIKGSPWALPNLGEPSATQFDVQNPPARNIENSRGGLQFKFNTELPAVEEATFGIAHYYTFFDTPQVSSYVMPGFAGQAIPAGHPAGNDVTILGLTLQEAVLTQVTGVSGTFAVPATWARLVGLTGEPIVRSELAYFKNEPRHQQEQLDPFTYHLASGLGCETPSPTGGSIGSYIDTDLGLCTGGKRPGDSWNFVLGLDTNQFIQWLNARNSFFITTQFFYKHLNGASRRETLNQRFERLGYEGVQNLVPEYFVSDASGNRTRLDIPPIYAGEVLPVPAFRQRSPLVELADTATQPSLVRSSTDQFLQTLLISTQYASGQIVPTLTMVYDWGGAVGVIPQITFLRDPFRITMSYSYLEANSLKGNAGVSLLRDRDNFLFQIEYVI